MQVSKREAAATAVRAVSAHVCVVLLFALPRALLSAVQPGVMVTRALSLGKLRLAELLSKELPVAILMAFTLGIVAYFRIRLVYPDDVGSAESIGIALFCSVILAVSLSIVFSILLSHITCCDPADGAVPLLSTVSDVISILLLVVIASHILPYPSDQ